MKQNVYTTIENQIRTDGSRGLLYDHFDSEEAAYAKYFTVLAAAAVSGIPYHEALMLSLDKGVMERRAFDRRPDIVEEVPVEEVPVEEPVVETPTEEPVDENGDVGNEEA